MQQEEDHRAGFVTIVGKPNAGKSTLMNCLVRTNLAITHAKVQTTRHKLYGITSDKGFQIIYTDTPGVITPAYPLQEAMMEVVKRASSDADVVIWLVDVRDRALLPLFHELCIRKPVLLVLNKTDLLAPTALGDAMAYWQQQTTGQILSVSALKNQYISELVQQVIALLPKHPPYYPQEMFTDRPERFFAQEIIREKILDQYHQEIPYSVEVCIDRFKEKEGLISIHAIIHVERHTQKGILIGHKGTSLKRLGIASREALEDFFQKKIFLTKHIKVTPGWRKKKRFLESCGYSAGSL